MTDAPAGPTTRGARRILVVDDEPALREASAALLVADGNEVLAAADGLEALELLAAGPVDLVLTDIEMPRLDGLGLLARLHADLPDLPVVMVTGHGTIDAAVAALREGAVDFLRKPAAPADLLHVVRRALEVGRLTAENRELAARLALEQMKSEFVTVVSHEIRTPLAAMKNCLWIVRGGSAGPLTQRQERFLRLADESVDRLTRLAADLLDAARLEQGRLELACGEVDLIALAAEVAAEIAPLAATRGVAVACPPPAAGRLVRGDRERLRQVLVNIGGNAAKFCRPGETVTFAVRGPVAPEEIPPRFRGETAGAAAFEEIAVSDNGPGIAAADLEGIFERFRQGADTLRREHSGIGLGLPIARGIVRSHGGALWAQQRPGGGSVFRMLLPRDGPAAEG